VTARKRSDPRTRNGRLTPDEKLEVLTDWFEDGGVVVSAGKRFFATKTRLKEVRRILAELGVHRSDDQVKTTHLMASELRCCEAIVTKIITLELRLAAKVGNINQAHPAASAIYVRLDEKTAQVIMDGDLRRKGWYSHGVDGIVEEVPDRPQETQPNLAVYAAQAWRQMAVVQSVPPRLTEPQPPALLEAKGDDGETD